MTATMTRPKLVYGTVLGHIPLDEITTERAAKFAKEHYAAEEAVEFDGEDVEVFTLPSWRPKIEAWWPEAQLRAMGYRRRPIVKDDSRTRQDMVVTLGVDQHTDDYHGNLLCYVLHNDGLKFKQGKTTCVPKGGDWFLFDDYAKHGVKEANGAAVFVGWTVPLEEID